METNTNLPTENFPKAAPGVGAIAYRRGSKPNTLLVGCAYRSSKVGEGYGITGGGFFEVASLFWEIVNKVKVKVKPLGSIITAIEEAYREFMEEMPGFEKVISFEVFKSRAIFLDAFGVSTSDINKAHFCVYFGLPITAAEQAAISALPVSEETSSQMEFFEITSNPEDPSDIILETPLPIFHNHEKRAFAALMQLAAAGKLPYLE